VDNPQERLAFDKGWIVGIIEGEGCFAICKKRTRFYPQLCIGNTNGEIMDRLKRIFYKLSIPYWVAKNYQTKGNKSFQRIIIGGPKRLRRFFIIFPIELFEGKYTEAKILEEYVDLRLSKNNNAPHGDEEWLLYYELKDMER